METDSKASEESKRDESEHWDWASAIAEGYNISYIINGILLYIIVFPHQLVEVTLQHW